MAFSATVPTTEARPFKMGVFAAQIMNVSALSGDTSGTLTATSLSELAHVILPAGFVQTSAMTLATNAATLAFTVPTETAASKVTQGLTLTAVANLGASGNNITIAFTGGGTAGAEVVTVTGTAISVQIQSATSTVTQVRTAMQAAAACTALVTTTGTSASTVATAGAVSLTSGVTGGAAGQALLIGRP